MKDSIDANVDPTLRVVDGQVILLKADEIPGNVSP